MTEKPFSALLVECDALMTGPITDATVDRFVALIEDPTLYQYAFQTMQNPAWIEPLKDRGLFVGPPNPIVDNEKSTISFPTWPEIQFLVRMAPAAPIEVLKVLLAVPTTPNVSVHYDLARAALEMPPTLASEVANKETVWLDEQNRTILGFHAFATLGKLISHLAKGGEKDSSLSLARSLLRILPDPRTADQATSTSFTLSREPITLIEYFDYELVLREMIQDLVTVGGLDSLVLLSDLLEHAIALSRDYRDENGNEDYSYIWRPSLETGQDRGLKDALVTATKKAVDMLAKKSPANVGPIVDILEKRRWNIFRRLSLYLMGRYPEQATALIKQRLTDERLFDLGDEWEALAASHFGELLPEDQNVYLNWVERGPLRTFSDLADHRRFFGEDTTEEDYQRYVRTWKRDRLKIIESALPDAWGTIYQSFVDELGERDVSTATPYLAEDVETGRSPKSIEELRSMGIPELVNYLRNWEPEKGESQFALASSLSAAVQSEPQRFATSATEFAELDPAYLKSIISGIRQGIEAGWTVDWESLIHLCHDFIVGSTEAGKSQDDSALKREALSLFAKGLNNQPAEIPFSLRGLTWETLQVLTSDSDPTAEYEAKYGAGLDPATLSINSVRGEAMHRVIQYGLWVRRALQKDEGFINRGFQDMPELQRVLNDHLNIQTDPSLAIRAVYGQWLPWLIFLDKEWTMENLARIFPKDKSLAEYREVAWFTYIIFCQPYDEAFDVLREEYSAAIERLKQGPIRKPSYGDPSQSLASHVMALYWRGKLDFADSGLLQKFFEQAPAQLASHAMWFVGNSLKNSKHEVAASIRDRLQRLWEWRLTIAHAGELSAFGLWFTSDKFEKNWSIQQLYEVLRATGEIEDESEVVQQLATETFANPILPIECLKLLVSTARDFWRVFDYQDSARKIIADALKSSDTTARVLAEDVVERLMAQGHLTFRGLLRSTVS